MLYSLLVEFGLREKKYHGKQKEKWTKHVRGRNKTCFLAFLYLYLTSDPAIEIRSE